jgi:hypothetical protein
LTTVLNKNLSAEIEALRFGLKTSYLQYHLRQVDPDYFSKSCETKPKFINKRFAVETEADKVKAERMVEKYKSEGLMFVDDGKSVACVRCKTYFI